MVVAEALDFPGAVTQGFDLADARLMIASAMEVVYRDEKNHYREAAREATRAVQTKQDLVRMKKAVREVSLQRVYMRNEMFKAPLTSDEIKSCLASHMCRVID